MQPDPKINILVATDFSPKAAYVLDYCAAISRRKGYELNLLHVFNPEIRNGLEPPEITYGKARRKLEETIDEYSSKYLIEINGLLESGNIFSTIHETVRRINARMLAMPLHRKLGIQHLTGRFAFRIMAASPVPVLLLQQAHAFKSFDRVLLPLDFSRPVDMNVEKGIEFATEHNSSLLVYSVTENDSFFSTFILKRELAMVKHRIEKAGLHCQTQLVQRCLLPIYQHILDHGRKNQADVILLMARNQDDPDNFFVGGTAGRVIENSEIPVIVFSPISPMQPAKIIPPILQKVARHINR